MFEKDGVNMHSGRLYGPFRAYVKDNRDPLQLGRIKFTCPVVYGLDDNKNAIESDWAYPMMSLGGGFGFGSITVPPVVDAHGNKVIVWVFFEMGDVNKPLWLGSPFGKTGNESDVPYSARKMDNGSDRSEPNNFCFVTPKGHSIELDDGEDRIKIKHRNNKTIIINKDGLILFGNAKLGVARLNDEVSVDVPGIGICKGNITSASTTVLSE